MSLQYKNSVIFFKCVCDGCGDFRVEKFTIEQLINNGKIRLPEWYIDFRDENVFCPKCLLKMRNELAEQDGDATVYHLEPEEVVVHSIVNDYLHKKEL